MLFVYIHSTIFLFLLFKVDYVTNSSEKFNIERDFKGQFEEMNSEVSQSSILVDSDNDNDNGDDDLGFFLSVQIFRKLFRAFLKLYLAFYVY